MIDWNSKFVKVREMEQFGNVAEDEKQLHAGMVVETRFLGGSGWNSFFATRGREPKRGGRHGSAPTKIIPWSVSWHPMIVRQRLEWSLGVHVRLARVSCGATLPIPDCLQTVTSYQGHASYNYIPTLASSYSLSLSVSFSFPPRRQFHFTRSLSSSILTRC